MVLENRISSITKIIDILKVITTQLIWIWSTASSIFRWQFQDFYHFFVHAFRLCMGTNPINFVHFCFQHRGLAVLNQNLQLCCEYHQNEIGCLLIVSKMFILDNSLNTLLKSTRYYLCTLRLNKVLNHLSNAKASLLLKWHITLRN